MVVVVGGAESRLIFFWTLAHASGSGVQKPTCLKPPDPVWLGSAGGELRSSKPVQPRPARKTQGEACGKESRLGSSSPSPFLLHFFPPFATFGCGDPQIISASLARQLDLHLLFCADDAFGLDCAPPYIVFVFLLFFPSVIPTRLYFFEFPALVPLRAAGVALISELIDSSVIGFISYPLLEVVKPLKARQEWFLKVYFCKEGRNNDNDNNKLNT